MKNISNPNGTVPSIQSSELKGLRVLFVHANLERCEEFEARAEQELPRVDFYSASTLSMARDVLKRYACNLAIFADGIDGKDFVYIQLELRNVHSELQMIPLIDVPTIEQLSAQRRIGGVHTFGCKADADSFPAVMRLVLNYARDLSKNVPRREESLEFGKVLQRFLFARSPDELARKDVSARILERILPKYDLSPREIVQVITAEKLYSPDLEASAYAVLLGSDRFGLATFLAQTASWQRTGSKPANAAGFAITLANFAAWEIARTGDAHELVKSVQLRPHFLMHPSIRSLSEEDLYGALADAGFVSKPVAAAGDKVPKRTGHAG